MNTSDFDYDLPTSCIAQHPSEMRDRSRLLVLNKNNGAIKHRHFYDIVDELNAGDVLVLNNTKVIPARLFGEKIDGTATIEVVLLQRVRGEQDVWDVLVHPGKRAKPGTRIRFGNGRMIGTVLSTSASGRYMSFSYDGVFEAVLDDIGIMPLPPYIHEKLTDTNRYQTVYAKINGSAAAPTAGLHFTPEILNAVTAKGVQVEEVLLHVGLGTFQPVKENRVEDHHMHRESYRVLPEVAERINAAKKENRRIIAVGTTSARTLESASQNGMLQSGEGETEIFIYPGYAWQMVDALITNFHLPKSTLMMLVSALATRQHIMNAYEEAIRSSYRFFSFGDAMFIQ